MGDDDNDDDYDVSIGVGGEFFSGGSAVSLLSFSFSSVHGRCCQAAFRCAISLETTRMVVIIPSTGFGAKQVGFVIMTDNDGVLRHPVCALVAYWGA